MRGRLSGAMLCGLALLLAAPAPAAHAQAGSAGGTIGKHGKSVSGGDDTPRPRATPKKRAAPAAAGEQIATRGCARVAGSWTGWGNITIRSNGTWQIAGGGATDDAGRWICNGSRYVFRSPTSGLEARYTLSEDGNTLNGSSSMTGFAIAWPLRRAE